MEPVQSMTKNIFSLEDSQWALLLKEAEEQGMNAFALACEKKLIDEEKILQHFQTTNELATLKTDFKFIFFEKLKQFDQKEFYKAAAIPIALWEGHTYVAVLQSDIDLTSTPYSKLENPIFILASWSQIKNYFQQWNEHLEKLQQSKPEGLKEVSKQVAENTLSKIHFDLPPVPPKQNLTSQAIPPIPVAPVAPPPLPVIPTAATLTTLLPSTIEENTFIPQEWSNLFEKSVFHTPSKFKDIQGASILKIVMDTKRPYHGYVVPSSANDDFMKMINKGEYPEHISLVPQIENNQIIGLFIGMTKKELGKKLSILQLEAIVRSISSIKVAS